MALPNDPQSWGTIVNILISLLTLLGVLKVKNNTDGNGS